MSVATEEGPARLGRQVAGAVRWNALLPLKIVLSALATVTLNNQLSRDDRGLIALITGMAGLLGTWIDFGIERSLPKFYPEVDRDAGRAGLRRFIRQLSLVKLALVLLLVAAMLLLSDWFFAFWEARSGTEAVRRQVSEQRWWLLGALVSLLVLGAVFDVLMQVLVAFFRQKQFNLISLLTAVGQPLLLIGAVTLNLGVLGILAALVAVPALTIGVAWTAARRAVERGGPATGAGLRTDFYRRLAAYSLTNYGQQLATMLHSYNLAVTFVGSLTAVAVFNTGYHLAGQALQILYSPLNGLLVPLFARLREEGSPAQVAAAYGVIARFKLVLFVPAAAGLAVLAPNLTHLLWPQYADSAPVASVMAICLFGASLLATARSVLMVHEIYPPIIAGRLVGALGLPLLLWLAPAYGPLGAALAVGAAGLAAEVVSWLWALRVLRLAYPWAFAGRVLTATVVMVAAVWPAAAWLLPVPPDLTVAQRLGPALAAQVLLIAGGGLIYLGALRLLGGLAPADREAVSSLRLPGARYLLRLL